MWGDAHGPSAPENAQTVSRARHFDFLSVGEVNSVPMPTIGERNVRWKLPISRANAKETSLTSEGKKNLLSIAI